MAEPPPCPLGVPKVAVTKLGVPKVGVTALGLVLLLVLLLSSLGAGAVTRLPPLDHPEVPPPAVPGPPLDLPRVTRGDKPAAHVVASPWPSPHHSPIWDAAVAPSLIQNGVRLLRNRLVVPRDGLYFVYAAAAFSGTRCPRRAPRRPLRLAVTRLSPEYPRDVPLLRAARSVCRGDTGDKDTKNGLWVESLYQGAVFQLRRGDQLAATTSGGRFLDLHGAGQAYFGVFGMD